MSQPPATPASRTDSTKSISEKAVDDCVSHFCSRTPTDRQLSESHLVSLAFEGIKLMQEKVIPGGMDEGKQIVLSALMRTVAEAGIPDAERALLEAIIERTLPHVIDCAVQTVEKVSKRCALWCCKRKE